MSYAPIEATNERQLEIELAIYTENADVLHRLSRREKAEGNDEFAQVLRDIAIRIEREQV
jgi:hypothetical protein